MAKDDERRAREQSDKDLQRLQDTARTFGNEAAMVAWEDVESDSTKLPSGTGERAFISVVIGRRGYFSRHEARRAAHVWRRACARYPNAVFYPNVAGYDDDPRNIWEFDDACRYVLQWARFAWMDDVETVKRYCKDLPPGLIGLLSACGVFGEEMRLQSLSAVEPTQKQ